MMRQRAARVLMGAAVAAAIMWNCARRTEPARVLAGGPAPGTRETLRVGLWTLWHDREVVLTPSGGGAELRSCEQCASLTFAEATQVRAVGNTLALTTAGRTSNADRLWLSGRVTLAAHGEQLTPLNPITVTARGGVLILAVTLPVENYVERVVASESGLDDSIESMKALAIVVRTFALHEAHGHTDYELCDSTQCQLLHRGGNPGRAAAAHAATLSTAGETLWYNGQRALAYFHKDCGGRTASPAEIWPKARAVPYLVSRPDRYCTADGGKEWASEVSLTELTSALAAHGLARPGWQNLTVAKRGESGIAVTLRLDGAEISAEEFRLAVGKTLGWDRVPSTWFEVSQQDDRFVFHGRGWGHGVGLCQKGAAAMAGQGQSAQQILDAYFPGTTTADEETGRTWRSFAGNGFVLESLDVADAGFLPELSRARAEASQRSGLNAVQPFTVRAFASTPQFRVASQAPGWVAAFTEGDWIGVQPLRTLAARHLLEGIVRHEFLHALVEREAGPATPLWLREGLVEVWSEDNGAAHSVNAHGEGDLKAVESALAHASTEGELVCPMFCTSVSVSVAQLSS
jgi:stage II sporulation protein D